MRHALAALLLLSGCALTSKAKPLDIRYYTLETGRAPPAGAEAEATPKLGLGHVTSSAFLRNPIVFRRSVHEVGTYGDQRWTEYPEMYLRRSLVHALFERNGFVQGLGNRIPTLDVELIAFEEVIRGDRRAGRVQLGYRLHDDRTVLATGIITVERNAGDGAMTSVVEAIGAALDEATARLSSAMRAHFATPPAAAPGPSPRAP